MYPRPGIQYVDQTQPQMGIKGRPVSSIEEARAISIDFDGSVFYFPDLANRRIYTKQINMDGTASLADLIATYGQEIISKTNDIFQRLKANKGDLSS